MMLQRKPTTYTLRLFGFVRTGYTRRIVMTKPTNKWLDWKFYTQKLYKEGGFVGYPLAEFREYFNQGHTPLSAYTLATSRRRARPVKVIKKAVW
jgi:hypothetical protein